VDDGSDQDHDSHIMVWQIRKSGHSDDQPPTVRPAAALPSVQLSAKPNSGDTSKPQKSPSFGQRMLQSISPSLAQKTTKLAAAAAQRKSPSPFETSLPSRSSSVASSVETSDHVSLAREAAEDPFPPNRSEYVAPKQSENFAPKPSENFAPKKLEAPAAEAEEASSYLRWNTNVESMMNCPEPGEDFTQLPLFGNPSFDRGLN
jgi:hypothetical protein